MLVRRGLCVLARQSGFRHAMGSPLFFSTAPSASQEADSGGANRKGGDDVTARLRKAVQANRSPLRAAEGDRRPATSERYDRRARSDDKPDRRARAGGSGQRGQRASSPRFGPQGMRRRSNRDMRGRAEDMVAEEVPREPVIQKDVAPVTDWSVLTTGPQPYTRVPYDKPRVGADSFQVKIDPKTHRPLRKASLALWIDKKTARCTPTHVARPGFSKGISNRSSVRSGDDDSPQIEAQDERRFRLLKELSAGDFRRWQAQAYVDRTTNSVEETAAHAVSLNDDLQPSHKAYTLNAVRQVLSKYKYNEQK